MRLQFSVCTLMCITATAALFFMEQMSSGFFIFVVEAILIFGGVELLYRCMPQRLLTASTDNCSRIDDSFSPRRSEHERRAANKVRMDLLAAFLLIALAGNWIVFYIHSEVIPFPLAISAANAFDVDQQAWKQNLRNARIDETFELWSVRKAPADHETVESQQQSLWNSWPWVVFTLVGWAVGSAIFLSRVYVKILRSYADGLASRAEQNVNRDIARLQRDAELTDSFGRRS